MFTLLRILAALAFLALAAFCLFGFMASFEPSDAPRWPWKIGYALAGIGAITASLRLFRQAKRP